jgi:dTDP-4-dehydrorhamnose 3,5-epimerase
MEFTPLTIAGAWVHTPSRHEDSRGHFEEQFKLSAIEEQLARSFTVKQVNQSVSGKGVIRGIHFTDSAEGQAKYVSCPKGAVWDVVVDLRPESSTFGKWDAVVLSAANGKSILISEGLGHAFLSLEDQTVVQYLCSSEYRKESDKALQPFSQHLNIGFSIACSLHGIEETFLSERDACAPEFHISQSRP